MAEITKVGRQLHIRSQGRLTKLNCGPDSWGALLHILGNEEKAKLNIPVEPPPSNPSPSITEQMEILRAKRLANVATLDDI